MKTTILKFGSYSGLLMIGLFTIFHLLVDYREMSFGTAEAVGYGTMLIALSMVFFGMRYYRDKVQGGTLQFGNGFVLGLLISLISAVAFGLFMVLFASVIMPDFLPNFYEYSVAQVQQSGLSAAEIEATLAQMEAWKERGMSPGYQAMVMFGTIFVLGIIVSLFSALILKKSPAPAGA